MRQLIGLELVGNELHQSPAKHLGHVGLDQLRVGRHQRARQVRKQVIDVTVPAQVLDHRVQPPELFAETAPASPRSAVASGVGIDVIDPGGTAAFLSCRHVRGHRVAGRDLDHGTRAQTEEPPPPHLAR